MGAINALQEAQRQAHLTLWVTLWILGIVAVLLIVLLIFLDEKKKMGNSAGLSFFICLIVLLLPVSGWLGGLAINNHYTKKINDFVAKQPFTYRAIQIRSLIALKDYQAEHTTVGIESGFVTNFEQDDETYYQYIVDTPLGYQIKQLDSSDSPIYFQEKSDVSPKLVVLEAQFKDKSLEKHYHYARFENHRENTDSLFPVTRSFKKYQFVIPRGTLVRGYKLQ
ncbi:hypothetical protein [Sporolactobacillus sp. KGMB 08714]|uniref:hypothetical protein n=1 Tax=Sporolactobacillus sp. KGMB 08714 TaxID=3064704 RepID=UPI002FBEC65E